MAAAMLDERGGACSAPLAAILVVTVLCAPVPLAAWENCSPDDDPSDPTARWLWRVEDYPHPIRHPRYCNRYSASFVCDPDRVIGKKQGKMESFREYVLVWPTSDGATCQLTQAFQKSAYLATKLLDTRTSSKTKSRKC